MKSFIVSYPTTQELVSDLLTKDLMVFTEGAVSAKDGTVISYIGVAADPTKLLPPDAPDTAKQIMLPGVYCMIAADEALQLDKQFTSRLYKGAPLRVIAGEII